MSARCRHCGSTRLVARGPVQGAHTNAPWRRWRCADCMGETDIPEPPEDVMTKAGRLLIDLYGNLPPGSIEQGATVFDPPTYHWSHCTHRPRPFPRWKKLLLVLADFGGGWDVKRPIRLAHDWGHIGDEEYWRRMWACDISGLPRECYRQVDWR